MGYRFFPVWDGFTRLLHWLNATCVLLLILLGGIIYLRDYLSLSKDMIRTISGVHVFFGYILASGILLRWIWLFSGPLLSSWRDVLPYRKDQRETLVATLRFYLRGFKGEPPFYVAHNPLAGIAYAFFFVVAAFQVTTGLFLSQSPPSRSAETVSGILLSLHDTGFYLIILYVITHIPFVIIHELVEERSIVSTMIHGRKVFREDEIPLVEGYIKKMEEGSHEVR